MVIANLQPHAESGRVRIQTKNNQWKGQGHTHIMRSSNRERGLDVGMVVHLLSNETWEGAEATTLLPYQHTNRCSRKRMNCLWMTSGRLGDEMVDDHGLVAKRKEETGTILGSRIEEERVINEEMILGGMNLIGITEKGEGGVEMNLWIVGEWHPTGAEEKMMTTGLNMISLPEEKYKNKISFLKGKEDKMMDRQGQWEITIVLQRQEVNRVVLRREGESMKLRQEERESKMDTPEEG